MKKIFLILFFVLALSLVSATFEVNSTSIQTNYDLGSQLDGTIKISFKDHPLKDVFVDTLGNTITLEKILNETSYIYNCTPEDCESTYVKSNPETTKTFSLNSNEKKVLGLYFSGTIDEIKDIRFDVQSNAGQSTTNQLKIDILNDEKIDTGNTLMGSTEGQKNYGCFEEGNSIAKPSVSVTPYCQKIKLKEAPAYNLGAWISVKETGSADIVMTLYDKEGSFVRTSSGEEATCNLQKSIITPVGGEVQCLVNALIPEEDDYYICISLGQGSGDYKVQSYTPIGSDPACGFSGVPPRDENLVFKIYAQPMSFAAVSTFTVGNTLSTSETFSELVYSYIEDEYELDCSSGCSVPIMFLSSVNQDITVNNILAVYDANGLFNLEIDQINSLEETGATITSDLQVLDIGGFFDLPDKKTSSLSYILNLGGEEVLKENLDIEETTIELNVKETAVGFPTRFEIIHNLTVSEYEWDFGDDSTIKTYTQVTNHIYEEPGNYTTKIKIITKDSEYSRQFEIEVKDSKELISSKTLELRLKLDEIKKQISRLKESSQKIVEDKIDLAGIESNISFLETNSKTAKTQEEYDELIQIILNINLPDSVFSSSTVKVPLFTEVYEIDLEAYSEISEEFIEEGKEDDVIDATLFWMQENIQILASSDSVMMADRSGVSAIASIFEVSIIPKESDLYYYILIKDAYNMQISGADFQELEGYKGIESTGEELKFIISAQEMELSDIGIFVMPLLSDIPMIEEPEEPESPKRKYALLILIFLGLIIIGIIVYIVLQRWYKIKYEKYLFKDRNNLYNAIVYVNNAKKQGASNEEIKKNLRRSNWSSEQIRYIMRRYEGKETGMYELPIQRALSSNNSNEKPNIPSKNPIKFSSNTQFKPKSNDRFRR
jgi:hypothetical protein